MPEAVSPRQLLDEFEDAREVLIVSYTASLEYFERFVLPEARALGALVTSVSDASMAHSDPVLVTRAGIQYLDSKAVCARGAFHPKLVVVAGREKAAVAIGSGNLTRSGWAGNAELWTVMRADHQGAPQGMGEVATFLRALDEATVSLGRGAHEALLRVADLLGGFQQIERSGPRVLHSLSEPILDQLPVGPVDELVVHSPYFDRRFDGLSGLLDRMRPAKWTVFVRPDTDVDGRALEGFVRSRGGRIAWGGQVPIGLDEDESDERTWHGKLVQWRIGDRTWALTGSPNVTSPALLRTCRDGNCELAVLAEIHSSLTPIEGDAPRNGLSGLSFSSRDGEASGQGVQLLSAFASVGAIELATSRPIEGGATLQVFDRDGERWKSVVEVLGDGDRLVVEVKTALVGCAIRLLLPGDLPTNEIFVTDPIRVNTRKDRPVGSVRRPPSDVVRHGLGDRLLDDLEKLRPHLIRAGAIVRTQTLQPTDDEEDSGSEVLRAKDGMSTEEFLATCDPVLGRRSTEYALLLPPIPGVSPTTRAEVYGTNEGEDDEGPEDEPEAAESEKSLGEALSSASPDERKRFRGFLEKLIEREPDLPLIARSWALRAVVDSRREDLWSVEDWSASLAAALDGVGAPSPEANDDERKAAATGAAVGLALLESRTTPGVTNEESMVLADASEAVAHLLPEADLKMIHELTAGLPASLKNAIDVDRVEAMIERVLRPVGGIEKAVGLLKSEENISARVESDCAIEILTPLPSVPEVILFSALRYYKGEGPLTVRGSTENGVAVTVTWCASIVAIERNRQEHSWGRYWSLSPKQRPGALDPLDLPTPRRTWGSTGSRPSEVEALIAEVAE